MSITHGLTPLIPCERIRVYVPALPERVTYILASVASLSPYHVFDVVTPEVLKVFSGYVVVSGQVLHEVLVIKEARFVPGLETASPSHAIAPAVIPWVTKTSLTFTSGRPLTFSRRSTAFGWRSPGRWLWPWLLRTSEEPFNRLG